MYDVQKHPMHTKIFLSAFIIPLGVMVNYGDLQFPERIMVVRRSEMSALWKARFAIFIASVANQAVGLGHTVCSIGPKYISHTVVDRFFLMSSGNIPF
jgi:hypothetical protein